MRRSRSTVLVLMCTLAACGGAPVASHDDSLGNASLSMGTLSASVDDSTWIATRVDVHQGDGLLWINATGFGLSDEDRQFVKLTLETTVGASPQTIGPGNRGSASIVHDYVAGWFAEGSVGSGTITLTSLTADRALGTFSFTGVTEPPVTPRVRLVKNGVFSVRLR